MKDLSRIAKIYIIGTVLTGIGLLAYFLPNLDLTNLWMLFILCILASLAMIFKVVGATERSHYNIAFLVYSFAFFQLGLPGAMLVIVVSNVVEWIYHRYTWYITAFNIAQYLISLVGMGLVYNLLNPNLILEGWLSIIAAIAAMVAFTLINHFLVGLVLWAARQENFEESGVMNLFPLALDFTFWVIGASAALVWNFEPVAVLLVLIPLYLLYNTLKVPALERKTEVDPKTGLFNAGYFASNLKAELNRANRFDRPMVVVMADLDLLRNINNTYGHLAGDEVLIGVANIIKDNVRDYDIVARFGGEEYAILMPETTPQEAFPRIDSIREQIATYEFTVPTSVTPISASVSFGITGRNRPNQPANEIIHNADLALYHAKSEGRNRTFIYSDDGIKDLFESSEVPVEGKILTLEDRINGAVYDFKPSELRQEPQPGIPAPISENEFVGEITSSRAQTLKAVAKDQPQAIPSSKLPTRPHWYSPAYTAGITILALIIFSYAVLTIQTTFEIMDWVGLIAFGVLIFLAEFFSVDIYFRSTAISTSAAPLIGGILLFGPIGVLVFSFLIGLGAKIKHRSPAKRMIFNVSNQAIAGLIFLVGLNHAGYSFADLGVVIQFAVTLSLALVVYILTTFLIAIGIDIERGISYRKTWVENFSWLLPYYLAMGVIAFALILSYQMTGLIGLIVIIIPLIVLRYSQSMYIQRTTESVANLRKSNRELENSSTEINKLNNELLQVLSYVIDMRDPFILGHSQQVVYYAVEIAKKLDLPKKRIELIRKGALIHDIGKLGIPESILGKKSSLTRKEYGVVKEHVEIGAQIINQSEALKNTVPLVYHHHERYDGSGYPEGLKGDQIPLEARILALADSVEAMASDRPYRPALSFEKIIEEVKRCRGSHFDPQVVDIFLEIVEELDEPFVVNSAEYVTLRRNPLQSTR
jgi:diguanylate cyclase (GGDEF)-like protein/putative nucleotidyltransferase with HDIG domain